MATAAATARILRNRKVRDDDFWFIEPLVMDFYAKYLAAGLDTKEFAIPGTRVRASWAGDCAHAVALHLEGTEVSDPVTVADIWRFNVGTVLHEQIQASVEAAYPGSKSEVKVRIGEDGSGHMDMWVVKDDGTTVSVEIKTINGTGFRKMIDSRFPEGPRTKYILQGAINAANHDPQPDQLLIAVFSLECMSPKEAEKQGVDNEYGRFSAQWSYSKDEYLPIAHDEQHRLERIIKVVDDRGSEFVPRLVPDPNLPHHKVINPAKGTLAVLDADGDTIGTGWTWQCGYCPFQTHCCGELGIRNVPR